MANSTHESGERQERPKDELLDLIWSLCEGDLEGDQLSRLNDLLSSSSSNRETYFSFLQVIAWLEYDRSTLQTTASLRPNGQAAFPSQDFLHAAFDSNCDSGSITPGGAFPSVTLESKPVNVWRRAVRRPASRWIALTTCCLLLALIVGSSLRYVFERQKTIALGLKPVPAEKLLDIITIRLATSESRTLPIDDIGFISIQGPAHLDLIGTSRARLYEGRIKVRIDDERGHGFVVETPHGQVTDLGTEFGVDVTDGSNTDVLVFEGSVDLAVPSGIDPDSRHVERLIQGEGLAVYETGGLNRIMSVVTGNVSTYQRSGEVRLGESAPVIADVYDNIRSKGFKKFYEIVPSGMREDALAYVDRPQHDWNGVDSKGLPSYLVGADYVKPFNSDKMRKDVEIVVSLAAPARLFVLLDDRVSPPKWLRETFDDTGDDIGLDCGPFILDGVEIINFARAEGAGNSLDVTFSVWERIVDHASDVRLGPNSGATYNTGMYAVAAVPLEINASQRDMDKAVSAPGE